MQHRRPALPSAGALPAPDSWFPRESSWLSKLKESASGARLLGQCDATGMWCCGGMTRANAIGKLIALELRQPRIRLQCIDQRPFGELVHWCRNTIQPACGVQYGSQACTVKWQLGSRLLCCAVAAVVCATSTCQTSLSRTLCFLDDCKHRGALQPSTPLVTRARGRAHITQLNMWWGVALRGTGWGCLAHPLPFNKNWHECNLLADMECTWASEDVLSPPSREGWVEVIWYNEHRKEEGQRIRALDS